MDPAADPLEVSMHVPNATVEGPSFKEQPVDEVRAKKPYTPPTIREVGTLLEMTKRTFPRGEMGIAS